MMNLIHHKNDFDIEASWTFCASGHGKGPSDGIGATVKSSANRSILASGTTLSSPEEFFNFTKKINEEAAKSKGTSELPINAYYLNSITIDNTTKALLSDRFKQLNGKKYSFWILRRKIYFLGRIKGIRQFHQFDPKDQFTIFCRTTSNSFIVEEFTLRTTTTDEQNESLQEIKTIKDISINQIVIFKHGDKQHLAKVKDIRESEKEVIAQCYEPPLSLSSYIRCFNKAKNDTHIPCKNITASFIHPPVFGRRNQLSLSKEQFIDIQKFYT
jgi:hypothetical protein